MNKYALRLAIYVQCNRKENREHLRNLCRLMEAKIAIVGEGINQYDSQGAISKASEVIHCRHYWRCGCVWYF
ncbi:hypothetical protein, partial [Lacticaseibacillus chiayiensis]|uniref:hypothetical protein n=1 Tax=Lacticaseibacillus chiayiensis TaxID=2100821 RepID=UPI001EDFC5A0